VFAHFLFMSSALFAIVGALGVLTLKNIMHACLGLLLSLLGVAGLYASLGADFVAAVQLVVYIGGVVILMVFAVMLTGGAHQKDSKWALLFGRSRVPLMGNKKSLITAFLSTILTICIIYKILLFNVLNPPHSEISNQFSATVEGLGIKLITDYVFAFEFSSVLLLGALVGAAMIARPKKDYVLTRKGRDS
jgi:NADH-quinone oxidoreductase subunit J